MADKIKDISHKVKDKITGHHSDKEEHKNKKDENEHEEHQSEHHKSKPKEILEKAEDALKTVKEVVIDKPVHAIKDKLK